MGEKWREESNGVVVTRACAWSPPGCHPVGCGLKLTTVDGELTKVEGDPEHPITQGRLCPRCLSLKEIVYHKDRILHPLVRDPKDRGKDTWEEISWDDALDLIEMHVNHVKEEWGPESIIGLQGTGREVNEYCFGFTYSALGSPNATFTMSGYSCYGPRTAVADYIVGGGYPELDYAAFFPDRYDDPRYEVPKYIMVWGKNPLYSNGDGLFGHAVIDLMKRGTKLIVIDPRVTWLAAHAEYFLQLRPGTDAIVALAMLNVIINEEIYDHEFVENWCYGFEDLRERVQEYPPERAEDVSWVPRDIIISAARAFANSKPSSILWGLALDTAKNATQGAYAVMSIGAICGYFDVPGGITLATPSPYLGKWQSNALQSLGPELWAKRAVDPEWDGFRMTFASAHPDSLLRYGERETPYPLRMCWFFGTNPLAATAYAEPSRWYNVLMKMEFNVVQDIVMTPTAMAVCDLFLPINTTVEHVGVAYPHFGNNTHMLGAIEDVVTVGNCKSDLEILLWAGHRLNPEMWPWRTPQEFVDDALEPFNMTYKDLQERVTVQQEFHYKKYEKGLLRPDGEPGFNTATGFVELKSTIYPNFGEDALPYYEEPVFSPISMPELAEKYPLILTTGARSIAMFHSEHRQMPSLRAINPNPVVEINPDTAAEYGIEEGDWVALENQYGRCVEKAHVTKGILPGVVHAQHGWWFPEQEAAAPNLFGLWKSDVNSLIPNDHTAIMGLGANYKSTLCSVAKVDSLEG
ncbi:dehydrogenase [Gordonibacter sp. 28C]|uniref:molybdopterin dinucleotide binding domain-containing protein n=1 Tax=Gordonibacter sp. 28C TaxID=2078569 RepID=UPI000DF7CA4D|nr:molybdopterin dinucleotide binding domain-containing protein [Gordonibacter sp. 28C]RDB59299.1 dehydrogenase [Gordonibacter sp. 28C]